MALEPDVQSSGSAARRIDSSVFRDGERARNNDIFIAVMGLTGSGKSSFISHLTKSTVEIGDKLQSCTREVTVYRYEYSDAINVYLVDTPGFDDTNLSDTDVLREIATWMTGSYNNEVKLTGILYLHRITDTRMTGSAKKNLFMFKKLCGADALKHVVLVTTMWEQVDEQIGRQRLSELEGTEEFWGFMLQKGSRMERHMHTSQSARRIVDMFVSPNGPSAPPVVLAIQDEMVNNKKGLDETEAGKGLEGVLAQEREKFRRELQQARLEMKEAIEMRDRESQVELAKQQAEAEKRMKQLQRQQKELQISMEKLHKEKYEALEAKMNKHRKEMEIETRVKEAEWRQQREELTGQIMSFVRRSKHGGQWYVEPVGFSAGDRTISLSLRGNRWAFIGPHHKVWNHTERIGKLITKPLKAKDGKPRQKRLLFGDADDSYYSHYHTGWVIKECHFHGRVKDGYPGLSNFLTGKDGNDCPTCISLGPQGSYFISTGKTSSFKCHPNAPIDQEAAKASRLWWGFEGAYVMEREDKTLKMDLAGHYGGLGGLIDEKTERGWKIKELAMDIKGGGAYAVIFENGRARFETGDGDNGWVTAFREYTTVNFSVRWPSPSKDQAVQGAKG